jgi:hypothetical protein
MYTLSEHALERVQERLTISPDWVLTLLEKQSVEVVCNENSLRRHRVFWSIPDEGAFVAVVNHASGEVITVYPALREDLSKLILTDRDPVARVVHTAYVNSRTTWGAMRLAGLTPPVRTTPRLFSQVFVARFLTREGQAKTKIIGRVGEGADIEDALPDAIAKAVELTEKMGTLGMTIELRNRDDINVIQEWVLEEAVSYGVGE